MSPLLDIPEDLCHEVLLEWLSQVKEWVRLDSAMTNKKSRNTFLTALCRLSNEYHEILHSSPLYYDWIYSKNINLHSVILRDKCFKAKELIFKVRRDSIKTVKIFTRRNKNMNTIKMLLSNCCPTELEIQRSDLLDTFDLSKLKNLIVRDKGVDCFNTLLGLLRDNCRNLMQVDLEFWNEAEYNYELIAEVISFNPNLTDVKMVGDNTVLLAIGNYCKDIKFITLYTGKISMVVAANTIVKCPKLEFMYCDPFSFDRSDGLLDLNLGHLGSAFTNEEILNFLEIIPDVYLCFLPYNFNDDIVEDFVLYTKNTLISINMSNVSQISAYCLKTLLHNCPKLTVLSFSTLVGDDLHEVFDKPNVLKDIIIAPTEMSLDNILTIIKGCPCLKSLTGSNIVLSMDKLEEWRTLMKEFAEKKRPFYCSLVFIPQEFNNGEVRYEDGEFFESLYQTEPEPPNMDVPLWNEDEEEDLGFSLFD